MATALKDACETVLVGGKWVHVDHREENHCTIVDSTLPDYSGESSAVNLYLLATRHASGNQSKTPVGNASYGIYSALGYIVLFTHQAAMVLDIPLPRKCSFRELKDDMREPDFCNFVWRLHQNIMHLAYSQGVDPDLLVDSLCLQNLLSILNCEALGSGIGEKGGPSAAGQKTVTGAGCWLVQFIDGSPTPPRLAKPMRTHCSCAHTYAFHPCVYI
ncbi:beclin 1-associated autophagy-related key regulator [Elysia marginata]|uniref:Beclin 1-associated autophagy-related key regulator n=1 Tax=Elysia marginata TaxID=1093978 RepID=A0AAV4EEF5_9GAST|nr:beclin 1-associated autophagy-related key regulator [Elysia marginata]